jgi:hypothetical protein
MSGALGQVHRLAATSSAAQAATDKADEEPGRYDQMAAAYLLSDAAGKQRWLEELLLHRADPACNTYMNAEQLERQRARQRAILSRSAAGGQLNPISVVRLLAEVDAQEQNAIAKLSRDYQFATAQAFHNNRSEFDKWSSAWDRIDDKWKAAGEPLAWQPKLIAWLEQAAANQNRAGQLARKSAVPPVVRPIVPRSGPAIQHTELEARIAGYNLSLSRLLAHLHSHATWTTEELGHAANELSDLATARHDLSLYWGLLPAKTRARMTPLEPIDGAISLLAARTSTRRRELETSRGEIGAREQWELRRLDDVSKRLATLASSRS